MSEWMIYGANGFTGQLIAAQAARRGHTPVLAGRSAAVERLARQLGLEHRVFHLSDPAQVRANLRGMRLVLHAAGPFTATQPAMLRACLEMQAHYLDITGEIPAFEHLWANADQAARAGITAVSGVGFDVVPTDGLAVHLARALPGATRLRLAVRSTTLSRGTAITAVEMAARGGLRRQGGLLVAERVGQRSWPLRYQGRRYQGVSIPWGDLSTAYRSTGIPTIDTFLALPERAAPALRAAGYAAPLLRVPALQRLLKGRAASAGGPSEEQRRSGRSVVWGEATDPEGRSVQAILTGPEAYAFTVEAALAAAERTLRGVPSGALTPSQAFGSDFVTTLPGVSIRTPGAGS